MKKLIFFIPVILFLVTGNLASSQIKGVRLTAYSNEVGQTDSTPNIAAWNNPVTEGTIAVSRDMLKLGFVRNGSIVYIHGHGIFRVNDTMAARKRTQFDIFYFDNQRAIRFAVQYSYYVVIRY